MNLRELMNWGVVHKVTVRANDESFIARKPTSGLSFGAFSRNVSVASWIRPWGCSIEPDEKSPAPPSYARCTIASWRFRASSVSSTRSQGSLPPSTPRIWKVSARCFCRTIMQNHHRQRTSKRLLHRQGIRGLSWNERELLACPIPKKSPSFLRLKIGFAHNSDAFRGGAWHFSRPEHFLVRFSASFSRLRRSYFPG